MIRRTLPILVLMAVTLAFTLSAQTKPRFSGRWVGTDPKVNAGGNLAGVVGPQEMTINQDDQAITINRLFGRNTVTLSVKLDGSTSKNILDPGSPREGTASVPRELVSKATWEGARLKISTVVTLVDPRGDKREVVTIETLALEGETLVVERIDEAIGLKVGAAPLNPAMLNSKKWVYKASGK